MRLAFPIAAPVALSFILARPLVTLRHDRPQIVLLSISSASPS